MVQYLTGSAWSVTVRRIMENIMFTLPVGALLFIPIAFGLRTFIPGPIRTVMASEVALRWKASI